MIHCEFILLHHKSNEFSLMVLIAIIIIILAIKMRSFSVCFSVGFPCPLHYGSHYSQPSLECEIIIVCAMMKINVCFSLPRHHISFHYIEGIHNQLIGLWQGDIPIKECPCCHFHAVIMWEEMWLQCTSYTVHQLGDKRVQSTNNYSRKMAACHGTISSTV